MVSEKLIIVLITLAILMSVASIVITVSSINTNLIPQIPQPKEVVVPDTGSAKVGMVIYKPATTTPTTPTSETTGDVK